MSITLHQALDCFHSDDLIGIGMEADAVRRRLHPEGVVSYTMEATIACTAPSLLEEIAQAEESGATGIILREPPSLESLEVLLTGIRQRFPELWLQGFTARELAALGPDAIERLQAAGLDAIGGSEPETVDQAWLAAHRAAHRAGMATCARIVFGAGETFADRLAALDSIRALQAETGGFASLAPISFHAPGGRELDETTAVEYLKTLAIARMLVENIDNLQTDVTAQGLKTLQTALRFGANDVGSVRVETRKGATEEELRRIIRDAGFAPAQRAHGFRLMLLA